MTAATDTAATWEYVTAILDRPPVEPVDGQLAAFDDLDAAPVPAPPLTGGRGGASPQLTLFDY